VSSAEPHSGDKLRQYSFGAFTLDLDAGFLRCRNDEIALRPKSFEVLAYLVERHGRLVSREELMRAVWPDVAVTDEAVTKCIVDIRRAVGDGAQRLIRTVVRRGYMFTAPITTPAVEFARPIEGEPEHAPGPQPTMIRDLRQRLHPEASPTLRVAVASALEKGSAERHPSSRDQAVNVPVPGSQTSETDHTLKRLTPNWVWAAAVAAILIAAGFAATVFRAADPGRATGSPALDYTQLTNFTDAAFSPALSADGRMLTFIRGENVGTLSGAGEIFIKLLPDGEPVQLTHDGKGKITPVFTPGGDRIAYGVPTLMTDPMSWSTWTVSIFGGQPKLLLSNASALTWIPRASPPRIVFSHVDTGVPMSIVTAAENRTDGRTIYSPALNAMAHRSFLSPDGKQVLVVEMKGGWRPCRLVPFEPGRHTQASAEAGELVGPSTGQCSSAAWSPDGEWMYFSVNTGNGYHIWRQRFPHGASEQVTFGATEEQEIAFAPDGRSFLTSVGTQQSTLWIHDARGERQITSEGYASLPRFAPDGKRLYFLLRSRANRRYISGELWTVNLETGQRERLLPDFLLEDYSISPDGDRIAFAAIADNGDIRMWLAWRDGRTSPRRLSSMDAYFRPFFGANDEVFFVGAEDGDSRFVYRVREDGSGLQRAITDPISYIYDVAPDGRALSAWSKGTVQIFPTDGLPIKASTICAAAGGENRGTTPPCVSWSSDGRFLCLNDRTADQIYALPIPRGRGIPALPDGGITSAKQATAWPGAQVIHERYAFVGADPSVYAFFRVTTQRNIYRVRVP
jgi:DNA-binding winged helix-turn-helix (wHTH) protein/Tol biopolymer transport system component